MRVIFWGTYDKGKPRTRILLRGLREAGVEVTEIHADIWSGIEDKAQVRGLMRKILLLARWLAAYPGLVWRYLRAADHDAVIVGYMGHLDVLVLWPFSKMRRAPVVWDAFLSLYDTVVEDRRLVGKANPLAWLLYGWEWLACRAADLVVLDTKAHADYFAERFRLPPGRTTSIFVGVEPEVFPLQRAKRSGAGKDAMVLFYGQFIPLHGIETIVRAAQMAHGEPIRWVLIGHGQEAGRIRELVAQAPADIEWIDWVDYDALRDRIADADLCLGIFGDSGKAARVIPNKVFQILSCGVPLITRDSPAIRELLTPGMPGVRLVPPADPEALLGAVRGMLAEAGGLPRRSLHREMAERITPKAVGTAFRLLLQGVSGVGYARNRQRSHG